MLATFRVLAITLALVLASAPVPPIGDARAAERYEIHLPPDYDRIVFDGNGRRVAEDEQCEILKDLLTGEPRYRQYTRIEYIGESNENGSPLICTLCALYDMEGKLIYDWAKYSYSDVFGDFAVKLDSKLMRNIMTADRDDENNYHALWNIKTNQEAAAHVLQAERIDDSGVLLLSLMPHRLHPRGVMDISEASPVFHPFPEGYESARAWNGYILAESDGSVLRGDRGVLMTKDYRTLLEKPSLNGGYRGLRGPYLSCAVGGDFGIRSVEGKPLYTVPQGCDLDYFDNELVLLSKSTAGEGQGHWSRWMVKTDGSELTGAYDQLSPTDQGSLAEAPAKQFLGICGNRIDLLDRRGRVTAARTIPRLREAYPITEGAYIYMTAPEGEQGEDDYYCGLMDSKLETIIEPGKYTDIATVYDAATEGTQGGISLFKARKNTETGLTRFDIFDSSGKPIIENLTAVGGVGADRISVVKGLSVGVMDFSGRWIGRHSVFNKLED